MCSSYPGLMEATAATQHGINGLIYGAEASATDAIVDAPANVNTEIHYCSGGIPGGDDEGGGALDLPHTAGEGNTAASPYAPRAVSSNPGTDVSRGFFAGDALVYHQEDSVESSEDTVAVAEAAAAAAAASAAEAADGDLVGRSVSIITERSLAEFPTPQHRLAESNYCSFPSFTTPISLAGRKRPQPTGGWGSGDPSPELNSTQYTDTPLGTRDISQPRSSTYCTVFPVGTEEQVGGEHPPNLTAATEQAITAAADAAAPPIHSLESEGGSSLRAVDTHVTVKLEKKTSLDVTGGDCGHVEPRTPDLDLIDVGADGATGSCDGCGAWSLRAATGTENDASPLEVDVGFMDSVACLGDFHFTHAETSKMCKRYPTLSTLKSTTALPLLAWLTRELDISLGDTRSLILRHPRLMAYRVTSHLAPKIKWLRERLGLGQVQLRKLVMTYPAVLSRSVEDNLEPKIQWLEERLGASLEEVQMLIKRFPLIFGYSTSQNLDPTVEYFTDAMRGGTHEIKLAILSCPSILSRSLVNRIIPRADLLRGRDIEPRFSAHKWLVSTYTDAQFNKWLGDRM